MTYFRFCIRISDADGVVRTRVGYCGGKKLNPTYDSMGDHTETTQLDFNPEKLTFAQLVGMILLNCLVYRYRK